MAKERSLWILRLVREGTTRRSVLRTVWRPETPGKMHNAELQQKTHACAPSMPSQGGGVLGNIPSIAPYAHHSHAQYFITVRRFWNIVVPCIHCAMSRATLLPYHLCTIYNHMTLAIYYITEYAT